ncbi:hypothetical protein VTJ83DRAFT_6911 [Remersonia thermophila]|uniref:Ig-like domain-containing protein n=1 Tax=Remersonia thermophila TaxID=72144 RepID=A0ABR4D624_9PEZI
MTPPRRLFGGVLTAFASTLVSAQQDALGCTDRSFTLPSWLVQNVTRHAADGLLTLNLVNRATHYTASLACPGAGAVDAKAGLYGCTVVQASSSSSAGEELEAAVELAAAAAAAGPTYHVKQSWRCDDRGRVLTFTAVGAAAAPSPRYASPLLVRASLTSPVAITPRYYDGPLGHAAPAAPPAPPPSRPGSLGRRGVGEDGLATLSCFGYEFQSASVGAYPPTTRAWFDVEESRIAVEQTWYCDDEDPAKPLQITASGNATVALTCQSITSELTGLVNRYCTNAVPTTSVAGALVGDPVPLAPYALEDPVLGASDYCTLTSILRPRWTFSHFALVGEQQDVYFEVILEVEDRRFQYPIPVNQGKPAEGEKKGGWYECVVGDDGGNGLLLFPYWCQFKYDKESKTLEVKARWACNDLDRVNLVHFSGYSVGTLDSEITCETLATGLVWCTTEDPGYRLTVPITNVTW